MRHRTAVFAILAICSALGADADLVITDLGKTYRVDPARTRTGFFHHVETKKVVGGNTSVRNESAETLM